MTVKCVETSNRHVCRQIVDPYLSWPSGSHIGEQTVRILFISQKNPYVLLNQWKGCSKFCSHYLMCLSNFLGLRKAERHFTVSQKSFLQLLCENTRQEFNSLLGSQDLEKYLNTCLILY